MFYLIKMCVAYFVYHGCFFKEALTKVYGKMHICLYQKTPSAPYVHTVWTLETITDTIHITDISPHTNLLAKTESLKWIIEDFKVYVTRDMKGALKDEIDSREIGGLVLFQ